MSDGFDDCSDGRAVVINLGVCKMCVMDKAL